MLESGSRRYLVLHGHVFDSFIQSYPLLTALADGVYRYLQWLDRTHHAVSRPDTPVAYFNSGCWTELPCTYLTVQEGTVTLQEFHPSRALALA